MSVQPSISPALLTQPSQQRISLHLWLILCVSIASGIACTLIPQFWLTPAWQAWPHLVLPGPKLWIIALDNSPPSSWSIVLFFSIALTLLLIRQLPVASCRLPAKPHWQLTTNNWQLISSTLSLLGLSLLAFWATMPPSSARFPYIAGHVLGSLEVLAWTALLLQFPSGYALPSGGLMLITGALLSVATLRSTLSGEGPPALWSTPILWAGGVLLVLCQLSVLVLAYAFPPYCWHLTTNNWQLTRGRLVKLALLAGLALLWVAVWRYQWGPPELQRWQLPARYQISDHRLKLTDTHLFTPDRSGRLSARELSNWGSPASFSFIDASTARVSGDGRAVAVCVPESFDSGTPAVLQVWDLATSRLTRSFDLTVRESWIKQPVAISHDGSQILCPNDDELLLFHGSTPTPIQRLAAPGAAFFTHVLFLPTGKHGVAAGAGGACHVWNLETGRHVVRMTQHSAPITAIGLASGDRYIVTADRSGLVVMWDPKSGAELSRLTRPGTCFTAAAISPDYRRVLVGSSIGGVTLWDPYGPAEEARFSRHRGAILGVGFTGAGRAVSVGADGTVRLWQLPG